MKYLKSTLIVPFAIILLAGCKPKSDLSQSVKDFEESNSPKRNATLYFYPSTIRMLKGDNSDSVFDALVKDVEKLKISTFKTDSTGVTSEQINRLKSTIRKDSFVDLIQMRQGEQQFSIFLRKENNKPREFLGLVMSDNNLILIDLLGSIPISSLPMLMNGNIKLSGFNTILNGSLKNQAQRRRQHEKHTSNN